ncbi:MAG: HD domain-containing protein [Candidatus Dojkabacteria bacterium]
MDKTEQLEKELIELSPKNFVEKIEEAIAFAKEYHKGQVRNSEEPFVNHPIRCAITLAKMGLETNTIVGGLFHNILSNNQEKKESISKEIENKFGEDVLKIVDRSDKISKATASTDTEYEIINKYILNSSKDLRPLLIKLADALDNIRTVEYMPKEKMGSKIQKVFKIYGPLAEYLNFDIMKKELEENALKIYRPEEYEDIKKIMESKGFTSQMRDRYIAYLEKLLEEIPAEQSVHGRVKSIYSIYNKLKKILKEGAKINISNISDLLAFRVITETEDECFKVLELVMDNGQIITEDFDDYISHPKPNGYMALQGPIILPEVSNKIVELQIMTQEMYYTNTYGQASHIAYKESKSRYAKPTDKYNWIEQIHKEIDKNISERESKESNSINVDIFPNNVFVFTPKGKIVQLDKGDTVVDFAYLVHTDIGNSMVSAKVNGAAVKHNYILETGDTVEIKTQPGKKSVNPDWIMYANSPSTQTKIQKSWKKY